MNILKPLCATFALATLFALSAGCGEDAQPAGEAPAEAKPIERTLDPVFAGQSEEEVHAFFNQKNEAALRERFRTSCAPNETVGGVSLPCFCVAAGWPEAIAILKEVGYDLNTPCNTEGAPNVPTLHAVCVATALGQISPENGRTGIQALLNAGADKDAAVQVALNEEASINVSPLMLTGLTYSSGYASGPGTIAVFETLLEAGADPHPMLNERSPATTETLVNVNFPLSLVLDMQRDNALVDQADVQRLIDLVSEAEAKQEAAAAQEAEAETQEAAPSPQE